VRDLISLTGNGRKSYRVCLASFQPRRVNYRPARAGLWRRVLAWAGWAR
jgi:hypothetical protein